MEFVTGHAGTDHISAADMASLYRGLLISDDVVLDSGSKLSCTMLDANTAEIGTGDCMLQAHHARVEVAEQLTIESGSNGYNRNDLIVARYSLGTGNIQSIYLAVIKGTAVAGEASDPTYTTGDIDGGDVLVEFPLWRIPISGITVGTPVRVMPTIDTLQDQITDGDAALQTQITALGESVYKFPSADKNATWPMFKVTMSNPYVLFPCFKEPTQVNAGADVYTNSSWNALTLSSWSWKANYLRLNFTGVDLSNGYVYMARMNLTVS